MMDKKPKQEGRKFSGYFYNNITYVGVMLSVLVLVCEFLLFGIDFFSRVSSAYLSILTYFLLPPFLILGLILIPIGARWKQYKVYKGIEESQVKLIVIDPSQP